MGQAWQWWSIVVFAVFLIGVTKSGFGGGVGLMIVPMTAISLGHVPGRGSEAALGLLLPLLIAGDLIAVGQYRKYFVDAKGFLKRLMPATILGIVIGGLVLWYMQRQSNLVGALMRIEIGVESISLVGLHWWRQWRGVQQRLMREPWRSGLTGGLAAISSTLAHAAGPIFSMYLLPLKLDRQLFVGCFAFYFFILNTAKIPAYWASGQFAHAELSFTARFVPIVVIGAIFGKWLNRHVSDRLFTKIVYIVTFALGWYILADGILNLFGVHIA